MVSIAVGCVGLMFGLKKLHAKEKRIMAIRKDFFVKTISGLLKLVLLQGNYIRN
jgi:hypothetical protein